MPLISVNLGIESMLWGNMPGAPVASGPLDTRPHTPGLPTPQWANCCSLSQGLCLPASQSCVAWKVPSFSSPEHRSSPSKMGEMCFSEFLRRWCEIVDMKGAAECRSMAFLVNIYIPTPGGHLTHTEPLITSGPRFISLHFHRFILHSVFYLAVSRSLTEVPVSLTWFLCLINSISLQVRRGHSGCRLGVAAPRRAEVRWGWSSPPPTALAFPEHSPHMSVSIFQVPQWREPGRWVLLETRNVQELD